MRSRISAAAAFCEGHDEQTISIASVYRIEQALDDALDEHRRFAGACRRADKQRAAARFNRIFLIRRPFASAMARFLLFQAFERLGVR